ncbi:MAG: aminoacyl-tRNA hydrolase [Patescibacteria group bacterium]
MNYLIFGLGNPGTEYNGTRHNIGARVLGEFGPKNKNRKLKLLPPTTLMNRSGEAAGKLVKSKAAAEKLIVIHDDLDLPFGRFKISFGRGSGGHRGVESIIKKLKTEKFIRLRIGIAPTTPSGKIKKPSGEEKIVKFILGKFTPKEEAGLKKLMPQILEALEMLTIHGLAPAMNKFN